MRRLSPALIFVAAGCGDLYDPTLGRCAEATSAWWPLDPGTEWTYEMRYFQMNPSDGYRKDLTVQERGPIGGLLGEEEGTRTWRTDLDGTGWRWFIDDGSAISFRRDIWINGPRDDVPCSHGELPGGEDVRSCDQVTPAEEIYFLPGRKRIDYRPDRLCENSRWSETYEKWTIEITDEEGECPLSDWRAEPAACRATEIVDVREDWSVVSVGRRIEVPAGIFEDCLCVRRVDHDRDAPKDATYCFARDIGKVYERDEGVVVECLAEYRMADGRTGPEVGAMPDCDPHELDD